jgi:trimeric autotransporter adhesin
MSTKTLRKRIALVAVSALTAGVFSVVSAPVANATGALTITGASQVVSQVGPVASNAATGTITAAGSVTVSQALTSATVNSITVTGGRWTGALVAASITSSTVTSASGAVITSAVAVPTAAGTNMVIKGYNGTTLVDTITITVVPANTVGVYSAANSKFSFNATETAATATDALGLQVAANAGELILNWDLRDALNNAMPASTVVYLQSNCLVGVSSGPVVNGVTGTDVADGVFIAQPVANTAVTCNVDVFVDGVKVITKSGLIQGAVASITVSDVEIGNSGGGVQTGLANVVAKDAAGNSLGFITLAHDTTTINGQNIITALAITDGDSSTTSSLSGNLAAPGTTAATLGWTCSGVKGKMTTRVKYTTSGGTVINSNDFTASCYGDVYTFEASLDKASYVPGDIATLTITAKDSAGNPVHDATVIGTGTGASAPAISASNMTPVTAPLSADTFTSGVKTYKFIVGSTAGSYQMTVGLPNWDTAATKASAKTVAFKIASDGAVSNADVLKSIVSLIASINKQIQALQKLILRR